MGTDKTGGAGWIGAATGAATGIIGMLGQKKREKRALNNQKHLMGIQTENQKKLNQHGSDLQYEMWKKTNYPAQMGMLKEAGLNAGLLYGQGGSGGATTGSQAGGSAQGGNAPAPQSMELGTALQGALTAAQIDNIKADTKNKEATADSTRGGEGTIGESQINKTNIETKIKEWEELYAERRESADVNKLEMDMDIAQRENLIGDRTMYDRIEKIKNEAIGTEIENRAKEQGIKLSKQQESRLWHQIRQEWVKAGLQGLDIIVKGRLKDIGRINKKGK